MAERGRLAAIRWPEHAVLAACCVAESALLWLVATGALAAPVEEPRAIPPWLPFALVWGASLLPRALDALDVWEPGYRLVSTAAVALSLILAVKVICFPRVTPLDRAWIDAAAADLIFRPSEAIVPVWGVVLVVAYAWWRGRTRDDPTLDAAYRLLRVGAPVALAGSVLLSITDQQRDGRDAAAAVLVFFVAALTAIGLARSTAGEGGEVSARAVAIALVPAAAVLTLAVVLTGLLDRDLIGTLLWALGPLFWGIGVVVRVTVIAVAVVALVIVAPVLWLLQGRSFELRPIQLDHGSFTSDGVIQEATERANATPDLIRYVVAAVVLLFLFGGVTRFVLRRRRRQTRDAGAEERVSVRPILDLQGLVASLLRALGRGAGDTVDDPLAALRGDPRWAWTVAIRERYREFLVWSAEHGQPRPAGSTPEEHAAILSARVQGPGARADIATLTRIYARARYGDAPALEADAEKVDEAWRRLEHSTRATR